MNPTTEPTKPVADKAAIELRVRKSQEELAAAKEAQHKADLAEKAAKLAADDKALAASALKMLKPITSGAPLSCRRVTFIHPIEFEPTSSTRHTFIDLANTTFAQTVLLIDDKFVHVTRADASKSFLVPLTNVASATPKE